MPNIVITHKHQTRANDCWYACVQMLRTYYFREGRHKTKPMGESVSKHRNQGAFSLVWGNPIGRHDEQWKNILAHNSLREVPVMVTMGLEQLQNGVDAYGPLMIGGSFGLFKFGHYIVVTGTEPSANTVLVNDPWHKKAGSLSFESFQTNVWKGTDCTIVANEA
jgi:hypothetical protein